MGLSRGLDMALEFLIFGWGPHPVMLRGYGWLQAPELPLVLLEGSYGIRGTEPGLAACKAGPWLLTHDCGWSLQSHITLSPAMPLTSKRANELTYARLSFGPMRPHHPHPTVSPSHLQSPHPTIHFNSAPLSKYHTPRHSPLLAAPHRAEE